MDEKKFLAEQVRGQPCPSARGGLPNAGFDQRGRRCRAGDLAAAEPLRYVRGRESRRLADHGGRPRLPRHAALAQIAARGADGPACAGACRRRCARARRRDGRFRRRRAAGGAGNAGAGRTARLRAARHVRGAVRGDRADRGPHAGRGTAARQPRPPPRAGHAAGRRTPISAGSARSSKRSSRPRATAISRDCSRCSIPMSCSAPICRSAAAGIAGGNPRCGSRGRNLQGARAGRQTRAGRRPPALAVIMGGQLRIVLRLTISGDRISAVEAVADAGRIGRFDVEVL